MRTQNRPAKGHGASYLTGQLLIAMPSMSDKRFRRSVIYMCSHSSDGAMGLIINQRADRITLEDMLRQLRIEAEDDLAPDLSRMPVHVGGPVATERGWVLHSNDYTIKDATQAVASGVCMTSTIEILKAIAAGKGPKESLLALGYSGWSPGQLESEIQANGWLNCAADRELIFGADLELKYELALSKLGIDLSHLVSEAGHA